ncbi:unnamed protein product [Blepharisma stoltei]|uniref:Uncharacterized protein n=1 Tax=Blepharisma stoltei TaxID=1481888 RepID=A0AAU9JKI9_9CILI|nr:unnamed protein product [Blepharisma stoltei]
MEKVRLLDPKISSLRQERLKLERKAKLREAHDMQNSVLRTRTIENEIKILQKQQDSAYSRNQKVIMEVLNSINQFSEQTSASALKKSRERLNTAKQQFGEMVTAHYPQWAEAVKDPIEFEKQKYMKSFEDLKKRKSISEDDFKKKLDAHNLILQTQEEYVKELKNDYAMSLQREKILEDAYIQEEQRKIFMSKLQSSIYKDIEDRRRQTAENIKFAREVAEKSFTMETVEIQDAKELWRPSTSPAMNFDENKERLTTPNAHLPQEFSLRRDNQMRPVTPEYTSSSGQDSNNALYEFQQIIMNKKAQPPQQAPQQPPQQLPQPSQQPPQDTLSIPQPKPEEGQGGARTFTFGQAERNTKVPEERPIPDRRPPSIPIQTPPQHGYENIPLEISSPLHPSLPKGDSIEGIPILSSDERPSSPIKPQENPYERPASPVKKQDIYKYDPNLDIGSEHNRIGSIGSNKNEEKVNRSGPSSKNEPETKAFSQIANKFEVDDGDVDLNPYSKGQNRSRRGSQDNSPSQGYKQNEPEPRPAQKPQQYQTIKDPSPRGVPIESQDQIPVVVKSKNQYEPDKYQQEVQQKSKPSPIPLTVSDQGKAKPPSGTQQVIDVDVQPPALILKNKNPEQAQKVPVIKAGSIHTEEESEFEIYTLKTDSSRLSPRNMENPYQTPQHNQVEVQQNYNKPVEVQQNRPAQQARPVEVQQNKPIDVQQIPYQNKPNEKLPPKPESKTQKEGAKNQIPSSISQNTLGKIPEIDIEASLEDSGQLDNPYLSNFSEKKPAERQRSISVHTSQPSFEELKKEKPSLSPIRENDNSLNSSHGSRKNLMSITSPQGVSPRPEPMSPTQSERSSVWNSEPIKLIENPTLNSVPILQRISMIDELIRYAKEKLIKLGRKITAFTEEISMPVLEGLCNTYMRQNNRLNVKSIEELIGFILALARFVPEPFLAPELARSRGNFTEEMILMKLHDQYDNIYRSIKEFLSDSIRNDWIEENLAAMLFTDVLLNYKTSGRQFKRCQGLIKTILNPALSRPASSILNRSTDSDRPKSSSFISGSSSHFKQARTSSGAAPSSVHSSIDQFQEVADLDF